jgi:hypothetical protein
MEDPKRDVPQANTATREEFLRDPSAVFKRAETIGSVRIVDANGQVRAVLSVARDELPVLDA